MTSSKNDPPKPPPLSRENWTPENEEIWQEMLQLNLEAEQEIDEAERRLQRHLDLLSWILRQSHYPKPIKAQENWPVGLWLFDWPDTWELVRVDPVFYDLARWQIIAALQGQRDEDENLIEAFSGFDLITDFLLAERPSTAGKTDGRRGVEYLVKAIFRELHDFPTLWDGVRHHKSTTDFGWGPVTTNDGPLSVVSVATALADRLSSHPTLEAHPEACLSADAIRVILRP